MSEGNTKRHLVRDIENVWEGMGLESLAEVIARIVAIDPDAIIEIQESSDWDDVSHDIVIRYKRPETDKERDRRLAAEERNAKKKAAAEAAAQARREKDRARKEQRERAEYERLKAKYA